MSILLFDIDGVICDRGKKIDPDFATWLKTFLQDKKFYWVTGSMRERTIEQIGQDLYDMCEISFHCLGNQIWLGDHEVLVNQFTLKDEEIDFLMYCVNKSSFPYKSGNHIEQRKGSVNFSVPGRNSDPDMRQKYIEYDINNNERHNLIDEIRNRFTRFDVYLGGDISIDICLKNCNKSQIVRLLHHDAIFFGDRIDDLGIDYPLSKVVDKHYHIKNGYLETWEILKSL